MAPLPEFLAEHKEKAEDWVLGILHDPYVHACRTGNCIDHTRSRVKEAYGAVRENPGLVVVRLLLLPFPVLYILATTTLSEMRKRANVLIPILGEWLYLSNLWILHRLYHPLLRPHLHLLASLPHGRPKAPTLCHGSRRIRLAADHGQGRCFKSQEAGHSCDVASPE